MITDKELEQIRRLRKTLHAMPEKSMEEVRTKAQLMEFLRRETTLEIVDRGAFFYACAEGSEEGSVALRADMDAVCAADGEPGHYCGHDGHSAILCGVAMALSKVQPRKNVYLIFQPGEEIGEGGKICSELICEKKIDEVYALHNLPEYPKNHILVKEGTFACASTGLCIRFTGAATHAAYPENGHSPAGAIARLILDAGKLCEDRPKGHMLLATVIGADLGSRAYGMAAAGGELRLTVRGELQEEFEGLLEDLKQRARDYACQDHLTVSFEEIERFPATVNTSRETEKVRKAAKELGYVWEELSEPMRWSEDFGWYLMKQKGAYFGIGAGEDYSELHTKNYDFPDELSEQGIRMLLELIK